MAVNPHKQKIIHVGDRNHSTKGDNNTDIDISGSANKVYLSSKQQAMPVPIGSVDNLLTRLAGKLLEYFGEKQFETVLRVSFFGAVIAFGYGLFEIYKTVIWAISIIFVSAIIFGLWYKFSKLYGTRYCKKCNKKFALIETQRFWKSTTPAIGDFKYHDFDVNYKCKFCGRSSKVPETLSIFTGGLGSQ